eukprot:764806-Hanusia_phi.AAC.1
MHHHILGCQRIGTVPAPSYHHVFVGAPPALAPPGLCVCPPPVALPVDVPEVVGEESLAEGRVQQHLLAVSWGVAGIAAGSYGLKERLVGDEGKLRPPCETSGGPALPRACPRIRQPPARVLARLLVPDLPLRHETRRDIGGERAREYKPLGALGELVRGVDGEEEEGGRRGSKREEEKRRRMWGMGVKVAGREEGRGQTGTKQRGMRGSQR